VQRATDANFTLNLVSQPIVAGTSTTDTPPSATSYWYRVYTRINGIQSATATTAAPAPVVVLLPLPAPTLTSVTLANDNGVKADVRWTDNSNGAQNEVNFSILRNGVVVGQVNSGQTEFIDALPAGTYGPLTWTVRANASNSALSSTSNGITLGPPNAPTSTAGTPSGSSQTTSGVIVRWMDNSTNETGFRVERTTTPGNPASWTGVLPNPQAGGSITTGVRSLIDTTTFAATPVGTVISYRVRPLHLLADPAVWPLQFTYTKQ
jgi:titin